MTSIQKKILFATICISTFAFSYAQEFIDEPTGIKKHASIIREVREDSWLVYTTYDDFAWFTWVDHGSLSYLQTHTLQNMNTLQVSDFEILDGEYVFYCGRRRDYVGGPWKGVFGQFTLTDIITGNTFDEFTIELDVWPTKLEVFRVRNEVHLAMVANPSLNRVSKPTPKGYIFDAYGTGSYPSSWNIKCAANDTLIYDDIAVTEKYVIATGRDALYGNDGYIVSFDRPLPGSYFIPSVSCVYPHFKVPYDVADTVLIEACDSDYVATATYSMATNSIVVTAYHNTTLYATVMMHPLSGVSPLLQIRDIKYNPFSRTLNLLQHFLYNGEFSSVIFHLDPSLANPGVYPTTVKGNAFIDHKLSSIDRLLYNPNHIIASGHEMYPVENTWLLVYQHRELLYGNCSRIFDNECFFHEKDNQKIGYWLDITYPRFAHNMPPRTDNADFVDPICR